ENVGESFAAALDARTGRNVWKHARSAKINWTTPFVWTRGGRAEVLFQSPGELTAYDLVSGSTLWSHAGDKLSTIPSPIAAEGKVLWKLRTKGPYSASPLAAEDRLYLVNETGATTIVSLGDEGKILGINELGDLMLASPAASGGALYLRSDRKLYCIGAAP